MRSYYKLTLISPRNQQKKFYITDQLKQFILSTVLQELRSKQFAQPK